MVIQSADPGGWYAQVGLYFDTPKITVYLPESQYRTLTVTGSTGAIELPEAFTFERAEITSSTGNVVFCAAVSGAASIQTTTGDIRCGAHLRRCAESHRDHRRSTRLGRDLPERSHRQCIDRQSVSAQCFLRNSALNRKRRQHRLGSRDRRKPDFD